MKEVFLPQSPSGRSFWVSLPKKSSEMTGNDKFYIIEGEITTLIQIKSLHFLSPSIRKEDSKGIKVEEEEEEEPELE